METGKIYKSHERWIIVAIINIIILFAGKDVIMNFNEL